jgi:hypothetical protein
MPHQCLVAPALFQLWVYAHSLTNVVTVTAKQAHFRLLLVCGCEKNFEQQLGAIPNILRMNFFLT